MPETFSPAEVAAYYAARLPQLRQRGKEWRGACPIHGGERESFSVNAESGYAQCFSECGRGWDIPALEQALGYAWSVYNAYHYDPQHPTRGRVEWAFLLAIVGWYAVLASVFFRAASGTL